MGRPVFVARQEPSGFWHIMTNIAGFPQQAITQHGIPGDAITAELEQVRRLYRQIHQEPHYWKQREQRAARQEEKRKKAA